MALAIKLLLGCCEMIKARLEWNVPWCIGGDFNVVRYLEERLGTHRLSNHMKCFNDFIQFTLVDLPLNGA